MLKYTIVFEWQLSWTLASLFLLVDYSLVKLTSEHMIKAVENHKYSTSIQNLPEASFDLFYFVQIVIFLPDNDTISYIICLTNIIKKTNMNWYTIKCKQGIHNILTAELYVMGHRFNIIKKRYWKKYLII